MSITNEEIESLLYDGESSSLDFKRDQYLFEKASDSEKSELLKDILAFANAWRKTDAYILIGVEEVKGGRSKIVGVVHHIDDAILQQFVNLKTNRPVEFSYSAREFEGKQIGILHILSQKRPIFLKKDFGKLIRDAVYMRLGSSTKIANPDDTYQMGLKQKQENPLLDIQFGDQAKRSLLGDSLSLETCNIHLPEKGEIPDYYSRNSKGSGFIAFSDKINNEDYYREFAKFLYTYSLLQPISFVIVNSGGVLARDVRFEIEIPDADKKWQFCEKSDMPEQPTVEKNRFSMVSMKGIGPSSDLCASFTGDIWVISGGVDKVQPKSKEWTYNRLYFGSNMSSDIVLPIKIFADNLPEPIMKELKVHIEVEDQEWTVDKVVKIADQYADKQIVFD